MGSRAVLQAEMAVPAQPPLRAAWILVQGRRGALVGCESLHGDSGGRGESRVKGTRGEWVSVCGQKRSGGGRLETCSRASLCKVAFVVGSSWASQVPGSMGVGSV